MTLDSRIAGFLARNCVLSLATARANAPWAASVFYAFDARTVSLVFLTEERTRHGTELLGNARVAGAIAGQNDNVAELEGIQIEGRAFRPVSPERERALFLRRFPVAANRPAPLWVLRPERIKFTCNPLGFGTKLHWERPPA
ncbi:MAG: pyridoxamine 5'-phosphate oxidase family protein [Tropicimonas sp.]|uniref:pyridoxamine 5'-phosphate oxidase family protein n=1 Tax=Tropicimonas sp. TaxID=2067044 RepID=UPI003A8B29D4